MSHGWETIFSHFFRPCPPSAALALWSGSFVCRQWRPCQTSPNVSQGQSRQSYWHWSSSYPCFSYFIQEDDKGWEQVYTKRTSRSETTSPRQAHDETTFQDKSYKFSEFSAPGGPSCGWGSRSPRFLGLPALQPQRHCKTETMETHGDTWFTARLRRWRDHQNLWESRISDISDISDLTIPLGEETILRVFLWVTLPGLDILHGKLETSQLDKQRHAALANKTSMW